MHFCFLIQMRGLSFKLCHGVNFSSIGWLISVYKSITVASVITPVDLCAESHVSNLKMEQNLSWYIQTGVTNRILELKQLYADFILEIQVVVLQVEFTSRVWGPEGGAQYG